MSAQPDEDLETIYWDYLETAERVNNGRGRFLAYTLTE